MADKRTRLIVEAQAKGFEPAARAVTKVSAGLKTVADRGKDLTALDKTVGRTTGQFARMGAQVEKLNRLFKSRDGVAQMAAMAKATEAVTRAVEALSAAKEREHGNEEKRRRRRESLSFSRGVVQGMGIGEYFPEETPRGFARNVAGRMAGRMAGGVAGAVSPLAGGGGFMGALGAIPGVGGAVAGAVGAGLGAAQGALATHQQIFRMRPLLSPGATAAGETRARTAGAAARAGVAIPSMDLGEIGRAGEDQAYKNLQRRRAMAGGTTTLGADFKDVVTAIMESGTLDPEEWAPRGGFNPGKDEEALVRSAMDQNRAQQKTGIQTARTKQGGAQSARRVAPRSRA
jgi:hypothetical protein